MKYKILYFPPVQDDLESISDYIAFELKEPETAKEMIRGIRCETDKLR